MNAGTQPVISLRFPFALAILCLGWSLALQAQGPPPCSLSKTNLSCELVIDRSNAVVALTVQMYSDQELTVKITNPLPFERYLLHFTTGQAALTPDVASSIVGGMFANLGKVQILHTAEAVKVPGAAPVDPCANPHLSDATWPRPMGWPLDKRSFGHVSRF